MNPVGALQCCPSRGRQHVAPEVDLRKCTLHSPPQCELGRTTLALKPRGDVTRNPKQGTSGPKIGHVNVSDKKNFKKIKKKKKKNFQR